MNSSWYYYIMKASGGIFAVGDKQRQAITQLQAFFGKVKTFRCRFTTLLEIHMAILVKHSDCGAHALSMDKICFV